jgi:hypothetical protein
MQTADEYKRKLKENAPSNLRFSNCSSIFWNGVTLSCYRKASYKDEDNRLVDEGYGYDFGDWKSYAPPELATASDDHKEFAALFNSGRKQIIASRTCSDMNHTPALAKSVKLLILTADGAPALRGWKDKVGHIKVCVSDADYGESMVLFGLKEAATEIHISLFILKELSCTVIRYYREIKDEKDEKDEAIDVGCCLC